VEYGGLRILDLQGLRAAPITGAAA
jgi:hypothetical protein